MRVAIIDIGSNAIRAAIYEDNSLGASEIFNEKFRSDVSSLLAMDSIDVKHGTYNIFSYFISIFERLNVSIISCVATEILRTHPKANEFIKEIEKRFQLKIKVLTGDEEARISAQGLISTSLDVNGIAADLGGGSLELAEIQHNKIIQVKSLPIGTKVLDALEDNNPASIENAISTEFEVTNYDNLYLIGGALRLLGRCYMDYNGNIIKNLHNLIISRDKFTNFLTQLSEMQKFQKFMKQYKINKHAIVAVQGLINYFEPKNLIISTYGLKEGVRFNLLPDEEKKRDIVIDRCIHLIPNNRIPEIKIDDYVGLFESVIHNLNAAQKKLLNISLILSQATDNIEKNHKSEWIVNYILTADIPFDQCQRSSLIVAMGGAFNTKINAIPKGIWKLLSKEDYAFAQMIGAFLKISMILDGPVLNSPSFNLRENNKYLEIDVHTIVPKSVFERVCEQLKVMGIARRIYLEESRK